jgi:hypothetical protein
MAILPILAIASMAMAAASAAMEAQQKGQQYDAQKNAAQANATADRAAGNTAFMTAADRGASGLRSGAEAVGSQATAMGQSGSGVAGAGAQDVLRQSETNQRMDFLNTIYGGQVQKYGYDVQGQQQDYQAKVAGMNAQNARYGGFMNAGTAALQSGTNSYMGGAFGAVGAGTPRPAQSAPL